LAAFAALGLSGAGLFAYEYYQNVQEQNRQEAVALQQREQEETDRHAQEAAQQRKAEIARYLEQARQAMASRNWSLADNFLNQATTIDPNHPAVVAARSELLAAQRPGAKITRTDNITGMELHWVEDGCFDMGSPANERDRGSDESSHQVCVKGFWIGNTEVTNNQYRRFKPGHDSGSFQGRPLNGNQQPVVQVNWGDAAAFAEWLSWEAGTGKRFRLPTEAEWEYAARAGTATRYHWGNDIDPRHANFSDRNDPTGASIATLDDGQAVTAPVGTYQPNALGLRDMAGNVWEWTCSDYDPAYTGKEQRCSGQRPTEGLRVVRGGSWNNGAGDLRSAKRMPRKPSYRDATTGFRVVMEE
jgi:formylglycine-generating enzyme required for sulfatase activity